MKRKLALFLAIVAIFTSVLAFAGCGKKDAANGDNNASGKSSSSDNSAGSDSAKKTAKSDMAYIKEKGTLVIGMTEYEPMNYKDKSTGEWTGFDTEFAQAVAAKLGVKVEFVVLSDWEQKFTELDSKSIDCIWNGMTITDEALKNASVTDPYVKNAQVVVAKKDIAAKYKSLDEMKDLAFAVEGGSAGNKAVEDAGIKNIIKLDAQSNTLTEVKTGASDACVIDITMANNMIGEGTSYSDLVQVCSLNEEEYGIAFRKGSDMTAEVNKIMAEMKQDGTLDNLAKKYDLTLVK